MGALEIEPVACWPFSQGGGLCICNYPVASPELNSQVLELTFILQDKGEQSSSQ